MFGKRLCLVATPLFVFLLGAPAAAQDLAAADALFNKGVTDMNAGRYDVACPAIAESNRLDPRSGTLFTLADCQAKAGNIATAVALFDDYLRAVSGMSAALKFRHYVRMKEAQAQKAALTAQIPELTLVLPATAPPGVRVVRGGTELSAASLGIALPLDPGNHVVTTQAPDGPIVEQIITLSKGEKKTIELEIQVPRRETPSAEVKPAPVRAASKPQAKVTGMAGAAPETADVGMSGQTVAGFVAGGLGVAGLALGGIMGGITLEKKAIIDEGCREKVCTAEGKAAVDSGQTTGLVSTIGFGVGIAGIAAGAILLLTAPSTPKTGSAPRGVTAGVFDAGPTGAALGVKGVW